MSETDQPRPANEASAGRGLDGVLIALLLLAAALRIALLPGGAAGFWGDEVRFDVSFTAASALREGRLYEAAEIILTKADHMGYKLVMMLPALGQLQWGWSTDQVALLGSGLFSTLSVLLVYLLARRLGGGIAEARWSALFMVASTSMLYWSRHLMPYDLSLFVALLALWIGTGPTVRPLRSALAGFVGFGSFFVYNGSWLLVAYCLVVPVLLVWPSWKDMLRRAGFGLVGFVTFIVAAVAATQAVGLSLFEAYAGFSETITQGDFRDGFYVIWRYLWTTEQGLFIAWLACALVFVGSIFRRNRPGARPWIWFGGVLVLGLGYVLLSNVAGKFVVYGRLVRMMVPFFALLAGWAIHRLLGRWPQSRTAPVLVAAGVLALAALNFQRPLSQVFPRRFDLSARELINTRVGPETDPARRADLLGRFQMVRVGFIWPWPEPIELPPHEVLLESAHPLGWEPYLFEGFNREQRAAFGGSDLTMRLIFKKD
jgi:MFS family permease